MCGSDLVGGKEIKKTKSIKSIANNKYISDIFSIIKKEYYHSFQNLIFFDVLSIYFNILYIINII